MSQPTTPLIIQWTPQATIDIAAFTAADFGGVDPKAFHDEKVQAYYDDNQPALAAVKKAKILRGAHIGIDPHERDHITVAYKNVKGRDVTGHLVHVYTDRE